MPDSDTIPAPPALSAWRIVRESRGLLRLPGLALRSPGLVRLPRDEGAPVLVVPGFGAGDGSTQVLRWYLSVLGYRVLGWGLGRNRGDVRRLLPQVIQRAEALARASDRPLRLVGWSLGGFIAREVARERPGLAQCIVTLGTPVVGGPKYTAVAEIYRRGGWDLDDIERQVAHRNAVPIDAPIVAIYSRNDGIVSWQACIDRRNPCVEHHEVTTTHLGMGFCPDVYRIVARALAARGE